MSSENNLFYNLATRNTVLVNPISYELNKRLIIDQDTSNKRVELDIIINNNGKNNSLKIDSKKIKAIENKYKALKTQFGELSLHDQDFEIKFLNKTIQRILIFLKSENCNKLFSFNEKDKDQILSFTRLIDLYNKKKEELMKETLFLDQHIKDVEL